MKDSWNKIIDLGVVGDLTNRENRRVRMLNVCALVLLGLLILYTIYNQILGRQKVALMEMLFAVISLLILVFNAKRKYLYAKIFFFLVVNGFIFILSIFVFPGRLLEYVYFLTAILLLIFFKRPVIIYTFYIVNILLFYTPQIAYNVYSEKVFSYTNPIIIFITFFVIMNYFIKEQDEYEKHIFLQNRRLLKLNEEKNQVIGIAAHDLKSPLKRIEGLISLIELSSDNLTEEQKGLIEKVSIVSKAQNKLILEILDLDKIENHNEQLILGKQNLTEVLMNVIEGFQNAASIKGIHIDTQFESKETAVRGEKKYLTSIFENILSNAIKFSPTQTTVLVSIKSINDKIRVETQDQGPGITEEDKKKLFGKFQRLSAQPTGGEISTGLGLAITKKYVEAMDAAIWCESVYGKGTSFIIEFNKAN